MKLLTRCSFLLFLGLQFSFAQIVHQEGSPASWGEKSLTQKVATFKLPTFDNDLLLKEYNPEKKTQFQPYRFAVPFKTEINSRNAGTWSNLSNGNKIWRMQLESVGAINLTVFFSKFVLKPGEKVFLYSSDKKQVLGPFTSQNNKSWGSLMTSPLQSSKVIVEYQIPNDVEGSGELAIGQINHGFNTINQPEFGISTSCQVNAVCTGYENLNCQTSSVAHMYTNDGYACTGTLLNNTAGDGKPLLATAGHCVSNSDAPDLDPTAYIFGFNWKSPTCSPTSNAALKSISGAQVSVQLLDHDFALLELSEKPPVDYGVFYAGWDFSGATPQNLTGIHHPSGDIMKVSYDADAPTKKENFALDDLTIKGVWELNWDVGVTEAGSSGSAVFDQNQRVVGTLAGGLSHCSESDRSDWYSRIETTWDLGVSAVLDPSNTGNKVLDGMSPTGCSAATLVASFKPEVTDLCSGQFSFKDFSQNAVSWAWDFGDGATSAEQNPTHTYTLAGAKVVALTVKDAGGNERTTARQILVNPSAQFKVIEKCEDVGTTLIAANSSGTEDITVNWFDSPTATTPIHTGPIFNIPSLTAATDYHVEGAYTPASLKVGITDTSEYFNKFYTGHFSWIAPMAFDVKIPLTFKSVQVMPKGTGTIIVEVVNLTTGKVYPLITQEVSPTSQRVILDLALDPGLHYIKQTDESYHDFIISVTPESDDYPPGEAPIAPAYPYTLPGIISIPQPFAFDPEDALDWWIFYDWEIQLESCPIARQAVTAHTPAVCVTGVDETPKAEVSALDVRVLPFGQGLSITAPHNMRVYIQDLKGRNVLSRDLSTGLNTVTFNENLNGLFILRFSGNEMAPKVINIRGQ